MIVVQLATSIERKLVLARATLRSTHVHILITVDPGGGASRAGSGQLKTGPGSSGGWLKAYNVATFVTHTDTGMLS